MNKRTKQNYGSENKTWFSCLCRTGHNNTLIETGSTGAERTVYTSEPPVLTPGL